jgi:hypothetical protein
LTIVKRTPAPGSPAAQPQTAATPEKARTRHGRRMTGSHHVIGGFYAFLK